ncbi:unnamed protein product [Ilex paraguariensis]|uniref:CASP-like protein n=1 Tax=Ilex paraguariensis TaxID=185542 RepID=A0ABC8SZS8_9AQUA
MCVEICVMFSMYRKTIPVDINSWQSFTTFSPPNFHWDRLIFKQTLRSFVVRRPARKMDNDDKKTISDAPTQASATHSGSNNPLDRKLSSVPEKSPEYSPARSSVSSDQSSLSHVLSPTEEKFQTYTPENPPGQVPERSPSPVAMVNRYVREEPAVVTKADLGTVAVEAGGGGGGWSGRKLRPPLSTLRRTKRDRVLKTTALGFRVCGFLFCLISFSVMVADKNQGWAVDSFDRYKEFRSLSLSLSLSHTHTHTHTQFNIRICENQKCVKAC